MIRTVQPELLDALPADDPRAIGSRRDLIRLNALMQHGKILAQVLARLLAQKGKARVIELGSGDGTLLLNIAQRVGKRPPSQEIEAILVDCQNTARHELTEEFLSLGWTARMITIDVFDFLKTEAPGDSIVIANLFLHHFTDAQLKELFTLAANGSQAFVALEPRRAPLPRFLSGLVGLIGCNSVTRHDARVSIEAGFCDRELSQLWPTSDGWKVTERAAGFSSHLFVAEQSN